MHARGQYYRFSDSYINWIAYKVGHNQHIDIVAGKRFAKDSLAYFVFVLEGAHAIQETHIITVSEGIAMGEVYRVIVI